MTPKKKLNVIIHAGIILQSIICVALVFYARIRFNVTPVLSMLVILPIFWCGVILLQKILERSRFAKTLDEMEQELTKEEEKKEEKPSISRPVSIAVILLMVSAIKGVDLAGDFSADYEAGRFISDIVPEFIEILTILTCGIFLVLIARNLKRGKVFSMANVWLIYAMSVTLLVSVSVQNVYWDGTEMVPNSIVVLYYLLFIAMFTFFAELLRIAVKMKEEQDLTI